LRLSVVIPVYNSRNDIAATIGALVTAVRRAESIDAELVVVDDGSTDDSADVAELTLAGRLPLRIITQPNRGRFEARRAGIETAAEEWVLLLDSRLALDSEGLRFVAGRVAAGERVWTSHAEIAVDGNPYAAFWKLIAELAWSDYFSQPRTTSFGAADFDRFPKGTGGFLAPRSLLLEAIDSFHSRYADLRHANDDTPLLRWIAEREPIHISPEFRGSYGPRTRLWPFVRHSFHRGIVFLDGHGRNESRFAPVAFAFYPLSALLMLTAFRRPALLPATAGLASFAAAALGLARRRTPFEVASLAMLAPVYAAAHSAGMWRGLSLIVRDRLRAG
jgi:glycosyltransferase involved in cell wall biosynthesis